MKDATLFGKIVLFVGIPFMLLVWIGLIAVHKQTDDINVITDAAYQENVNRAASAALEKTIVDSGKETILQLRAEMNAARAATSDKPPSDARYPSAVGTIVGTLSVN